MLSPSSPCDAQKEASEVYFASTKLFQNKDTNLRRMVYLCIKDICPSADEVIIVTSSLMKDMNSKVRICLDSFWSTSEAYRVSMPASVGTGQDT